jgi:aminocarboxymuconate-semialdehyde decarboxylase
VGRLPPQLTVEAYNPGEVHRAMTVIDMHNHMIAPAVVAFLERDGERFGTRIADRDGGRFAVIEDTAMRPINERMIQPAARLADMDALGIDVQVISCVPFIMYPDVLPELGLAIAQVNNDALAEVGRRQSARFVPVASVPLQNPVSAAKELERASGLGMRAVQVPPKVGEQGLDEPQFEAFWAAAEALRMPVIIHPFEAAPRGPLARYGLGNFAGNLFDTGLAASLLICGGVLERHPELRLVLCHAGGALPSLLGRLDNGYRLMGRRGMPISRPPSSFMDQVWLDIVSFNRELLKYLAATYGAEHLVIGTDYPLAGGIADPVAEVRALGLAPADEALVLGANARGLLATG